MLSVQKMSLASKGQKSRSNFYHDSDRKSCLQIYIIAQLFVLHNSTHTRKGACVHGVFNNRGNCVSALWPRWWELLPGGRPSSERECLSRTDRRKWLRATVSETTGVMLWLWELSDWGLLTPLYLLWRWRGHLLGWKSQLFSRQPVKWLDIDHLRTFFQT